jgi:hypothetical protein
VRHCLERLKGGLLFLMDREQLVEFGDLEYFLDLFRDSAKDQLAAYRLNLSVQSNEFSQRGAGEELNIAEIEQNLAAAELVHQAEEIVADHLNVLFIQDLFIDEIDNGDVAHVLDLEASATRLLGHTATPVKTSYVPGGGEVIPALMSRMEPMD